MNVTVSQQNVIHRIRRQARFGPALHFDSCSRIQEAETSYIIIVESRIHLCLMNSNLCPVTWEVNPDCRMGMMIALAKAAYHVYIIHHPLWSLTFYDVYFICICMYTCMYVCEGYRTISGVIHY